MLHKEWRVFEQFSKTKDIVLFVDFRNGSYKCYLLLENLLCRIRSNQTECVKALINLLFDGNLNKTYLVVLQMSVFLLEKKYSTTDVITSNLFIILAHLSNVISSICSKATK